MLSDLCLFKHVSLFSPVDYGPEYISFIREETLREGTNICPSYIRRREFYVIVITASVVSLASSSDKECDFYSFSIRFNTGTCQYITLNKFHVMYILMIVCILNS